ncbi:MAG: 30S ribosomal protein S5 [Thaumarchaeota archaeon]|nr:30S ribosomal protein S5 [Candidatus Calditenuaceae archaeon]MDW8043014.1 30S ribosomal protein S5 [Nitrososphaerota archaeon]
MLETWTPRTKVGQLVRSGRINSIEELIANHYRITEPEIVDYLMPNIEQEVIDIQMVQRQTDAGERSSYRAIVAVGNRDGYVGLGVGKSTHVVMAIEKATMRAKMNLSHVVRGCGSWECACGEPHSLITRVRGKYGSVEIEVLPGPRGLGLVAGDIAKTILRLAGVEDCWTRTFGETRTPLSMAGATYVALKNTLKFVLPAAWKA